MGTIQTNILDIAARKIAVTSIRGYQKFISPYKGFSCAHRVLYGGESCSQYFKRVIAEAGLFAAMEVSRQRFQACREANQILRAVKASAAHPSDGGSEESDLLDEGNDSGERKKKNRASQFLYNCDACNDCDACGDMATAVPDCAGLDCSAIDCSGKDCSAMDCSGLDCSGLDCGSLDLSGLDCGSCDCGGCGS